MSVFFVLVAFPMAGLLGTWWLPRVLWVFVGAAHGLLLGFYESQPIIDDLLDLTKQQNELLTKQNATLHQASVTIANQAAFVEDAMSAITNRLPPPKIQ